VGERESATARPDVWHYLAGRLSAEHLSQRTLAQAEHVAWMLSRGRGRLRLHLEEIPGCNEFVGTVLRLTGTLAAGVANALRLEVREHQVPIPGLPAGLDGLRILQLSDLHLDGHPDLPGVIAQRLATVRCDVAVLTGDYRFLTTGPFVRALQGMEQLLAVLSPPLGVHAILGNHDFVEMVQPLEEMGVRFLLNENRALDGPGSPFLAGLDDTHYYGTADLDKALAGVPAGLPVVLLVHSPELIREAAARGCALYLTGHTHGGQICLPGGIPIITNARCPRRYCSGPWRAGALQGYTSTGCGSSGVFARFGCAPEITVHVLCRGDARAPGVASTA
jgi:predicted MPP superfamily phosphohydrolase